MRWGPFEEKGDGLKGPSMTRLVAFMFAGVYCATLLVSARTSATSMGWPFAALGIVVLMAVPLQALFRTLQKWLATPPGQKILGAVLDRLSTTVTTKVETGENAG